MKIASLRIENFRGIQKVQVDHLSDTIIICGQNGSGKSCIFDAIRLLKSTYGGYQQNEWQHFFGEFAIQLQGGMSNLRGLFNDLSKPVQFFAEFELRDEERAYINDNAAELLEEFIWLSVLPEAFQFGGYRKALFSAQIRDRQQEVNDRVQLELPKLSGELAQPSVSAQIIIHPDGKIFTRPSILLSVVFSTYRPRSIGVIDFHGAQRHYGRENVQGINLNLDQLDQNQRVHSLYNYNNKYANVKSEMAGNFIKELLAEKASSGTLSERKPLSETLKELFEVFFPDKEFLGPQPTMEGSLDFPVKTQNGSIHDLDELSSGEKEILYGYLRIRSSAPKNSIILLDEPELHLNPRLIRGLPEFYRKNLGEMLSNQLWLVTHSDALIREAVGKPGFSVFHMLPSGSDVGGDNQLKELSVSGDLDSALADLVGDLAAYRPGGKGVIFEGGGDSDFDKTMVSRLFAEELRGINLISGSNKARVRQLHDVLDRAYRKGDLKTKFYAIMDRDSGLEQESAAVGRYHWDVYHIENYLLDAPIISSVLNSIGMGSKITSYSVEEDLKIAARQVVPTVLAQRLRAHANSLLVGCINIAFAPDRSEVGKEVYNAAQRSIQRISEVAAEQLTEPLLVDLERLFTQEIEASFSSGRWRIDLPGREILRRFCSQVNSPVGYEVLRNLVVAEMVNRGHKPAAMASIIRRIVES